MLSGVLDSDGAARRALRAFCDAFDIPIRHLRGRAGFLPGTTRNMAGLIKPRRHVLSLQQCTCRLVYVITRKAFGVPIDVMASKHVAPDVKLCWRRADAVHGRQGRGRVIFRADIGERAQDAAARTKEYEDRSLSPSRPPSAAYIDGRDMRGRRGRGSRARSRCCGEEVELRPPARQFACEKRVGWAKLPASATRSSSTKQWSVARTRAGGA